MSDEFTVIRALGKGGMGDVYLAEQATPLGNRQVALKRLRLASQASTREHVQFAREATIGEQLRHPNVVAVHAHGQDADGWYLVLDYVDGVSAGGLVRFLATVAEPFPSGPVLTLALDLATGLDYVHHFESASLGVRGLVHRDVTPDNVLIGVDGRARLSDFGIAMSAGATRLTDAGLVRGKVGYIAPELLEQQDATAASDVFSVAATLTLVSTGVLPFHGRNDAELMWAMMTAQPSSLRLVRPDLPPTFSDWVDQALRRRPNERPSLATLISVLQALGADSAEARSALGALVLRARPSEPAPPPVAAQVASGPAVSVAKVEVDVDAAQPPARRSGRSLLVVAGLGLGLVGTGMGLWRARHLSRLDEPTLAGETSPGQPEPFVASPPERLEPERTGENKAEPVAAQPVEAAEPELAPKAVDPTKAPTTAAAARFAGKGTLSIKVKPYAEVFVDGESLGVTPMRPFTVKAGPHSVLLINNELGQRREMNVVVRPGQVSPVTLDFAEHGQE